MRVTKAPKVLRLEVKGGFLNRYVSLVGANGETLMHSEGYYSKSNARRAAAALALKTGASYIVQEKKDK